MGLPRNDVEDTGDLTGRKLWEYRTWRQKDGDLNNVSLHTQLSTVKVWLQWLGNIEAADPELADKIDVPELDRGEDARREALSEEAATAIDRYLARYEYASRDYALWTLLYGVGMRLGAAHGIDVPDVDLDEKQLHIHHRLETGTTLKTGDSGERVVALTSTMQNTLRDYIRDRRIEVVDDQGRRPLLTSEHGRWGFF